MHFLKKKTLINDPLIKDALFSVYHKFHVIRYTGRQVFEKKIIRGDKFLKKDYTGRQVFENKNYTGRQVFEKKIIRGDKFLKKKLYGATSFFEGQISSHPGRYPHKFWTPPKRAVISYISSYYPY